MNESHLNSMSREALEVLVEQYERCIDGLKEQVARLSKERDQPRPCCGHADRYHDDIPDGTHACVHCAWLAARAR